MAEKNSKGKKRKWEPVEFDDPSFFAGEMDEFVSLEVMEDYHPVELAGIGAEEENKRTAAAGGELLKAL